MSFLAAAGGVLGAIAGSQGSGGSQTTSVKVKKEGEQERDARELLQKQLGDIEGLVGAGPGQEAVTQGLEAQNQFAGDLEALRSQGLRPQGIDLEASRAQLEPQRVQMDQAFEDEQMRANRLAAQLNRPVNDPIIQAKLSQERMRQEERFGAQVSAGAQDSRMQRLGFSEALAQVRGGLATQAMQNRMTLAGLGQGIQQMGMNFRMGTASQTTSSQSGGGFAGALSGAIGGAGAGFGFAKQFSGGGGSGGAGSVPVDTGSQFGPFFK